MRFKLAFGDFVFDRAAVGFRKNFDGDVIELITAVADHGRQRRNVIGINNDFADMTLDGISNGRTARAATGGNGCRKSQKRGKCRNFAELH